MNQTPKGSKDSTSTTKAQEKKNQTYSNVCSNNPYYNLFHTSCSIHSYYTLLFIKNNNNPFLKKEKENKTVEIIHAIIFFTYPITHWFFI
jgi:hypothetical protein